MEDLVASVTAMSTARMRGIHTRSDPEPVFNDPWGDRLVPASMLVSAIAQRDPGSASAFESLSDDEIAALSDDFLRSSPAFTNVIVRARYTEDALTAAIARGVRQYVLIGAGFDTYALRVPPEAGKVTVIEIDHPATQTLKQRRIGECDLSVPDNVHFVTADLAKESLDAVLEKSMFNPAEPAFFAWLGVTMYLSRDANMTTLTSIAQSSAAGSELVFSYIDQKWFEPEGTSQSAPFEDLERTVKSFGEPFISGFHPTSLSSELGDVGLDLVEDVNEFQLVERYDPAGVNALKPADRSHVARARVRTGAQS